MIFASSRRGGCRGSRGESRRIAPSNWRWPPLRMGTTPNLLVTGTGPSCPCVTRIQQNKRTINSLMNTEATPLGATITNFCNGLQPVSVPNISENHPRTLKLLFSKELTNSDIQKKSKILLPKREAEFHLPRVQARQKIRLYMDDKEINRTWCFSFRFRMPQSSRVFSLEGTRQFIEAHGLQAKDSIVIYRDVNRRTYVIEAAKKKREASTEGSSNTDLNSLDRKLESPESCSYTYLEKLSEYKIVDEMEEAARPGTPYLYGNANWSEAQPNHKKRKLLPLESFRFFDFPLEYIVWT